MVGDISAAFKFAFTKGREMANNKISDTKTAALEVSLSSKYESNIADQ